MSHSEEKSNNYFEKRSNITNNKLYNAFRRGKQGPNSVPQDKTPYFILLVGSPGVGKTTQIKHYISDHLGMSYDDFFHISLDFIVEKVKPYRNKTQEAVRALSEIHTPLTNTNYALLSKYYLPIIGSTSNDFGLNKTHMSVMENIKSMKNKSNSTSKGGAGNNAPKKRTVTRKTKKNANQDPNHSAKQPQLYKLVDKGLEYAVQQRMNIIYDTTLTSKNSVEKIEKILALTGGAYKTLVILVSANERFSRYRNGTNYQLDDEKSDEKMDGEYNEAELVAVKERLSGRHESMAREGFIRAIPPKLVKIFVKDNEEGFKKAVAHYGPSKKDDPLRFIVMYNPTKK